MGSWSCRPTSRAPSTISSRVSYPSYSGAACTGSTMPARRCGIISGWKCRLRRPRGASRTRMFHMCWALSDGSSKLIPIDEQPNHQIVHLFRLGKAKSATHEPLNPGPKIDVLALDFLGVFLPHVMLLGIEMPLVGSPAVRVKL